MHEAEITVLDASVGVKWFKEEAGSAEARALLRDHRSGRRRIVVPVLFKYELVGVATRRGTAFGAQVWGLLGDAELTTIALDDVLAEAALEQCDLLGCSFYDALAPGLAKHLGAPLYSADARAHASFPGVVLFA